MAKDRTIWSAMSKVGYQATISINGFLLASAFIGLSVSSAANGQGTSAADSAARNAVFWGSAAFMLLVASTFAIFC